MTQTVTSQTIDTIDDLIEALDAEISRKGLTTDRLVAKITLQRARAHVRRIN